MCRRPFQSVPGLCTIQREVLSSCLSLLLAVQARLASLDPSSTARAAPARAPAATAATAAAVAPPPPPPPINGAAADFQQLLATQLAGVLDAAEAIGGQVLQASRLLAEGFRREAVVVAAFATCQVSSSRT